MRNLLIAAGIAAALFSTVEPADAQRRPRAATSCPAGTVPVPETDNCVPARRGRDRVDNRRGDFDNAGRGSRGSGPDRRDPGQRDRYDGGGRRSVSTICHFTSGPRAGTSFDYARMGLAPIASGSPCNDGVASNGYAGGGRRR